jgi:hypothetical protein
MSKVRVKCAHCGKHFKSASAKQILCPDCEARERRQRAAAKSSGATARQPVAATPAAAPKIVGPAAAILVPGMAPAPSEPAQITDQAEPSEAQTSEPARVNGKSGDAPQSPSKGRSPQSQRAKSKPPREPKPPTPPFKVTDEIRASIELRYLDLAQPVEFDGIRTKIAADMNVPKVAVKRVIRELRDRMHLPSWWELRAFTGTDEDLERIRAAYLPLLPVPEVGVHKQLADQLALPPMVVYQGIRRIRAEMRLPQYNPPELHTDASATEDVQPMHEAEPSTSPTA